MQFRHKIRKLVDGQSLASARKRTLRLLRPKRFQLDTKRVIETIDPAEFEQIRQRYRVADPGADWPKYLDLDRWIGVNIRRIRQLELDVARPKQILDLGCGAGYFLYIAQLLGHSGIGLDMCFSPVDGLRARRPTSPILTPAEEAAFSSRLLGSGSRV